MTLFDIKGTVDTILPLQTFGSGFQKRAIVINTKGDGDKRDNLVKLTATKDNISVLDGLSKGDEVNVRFFIDGHPWDGPKGRQYFVDLTIVNIKCVSANSVCPSPAVPKQSDVGPEESEEMPF